MSQHDQDNAALLLEQVRDALVRRTPLRIQGSDSKAFLGRPVSGQTLDTRAHRGIVSYDPTELVITARAGTPLSDVKGALADCGQMLPCEPPAFGPAATLGGMVASGLSGPRRPWAGAVRDFVLGTRLISGMGQHLRFGGEVMKNVAGYDLSRLMAGSFGCLGVLTEVSLKVLPVPRACLSVRLELSQAQALQRLADWGQQPLPISAACHDGQALNLRLEGGEGSVAAAHDRLGGERLSNDFWHLLNEHHLPFFDDPRPLWRLSLPNNTAALSLPGTQLLDWAGAQRWLKAELGAEEVRQAISAVGGHATAYGSGHAYPFQPLPAALLTLQQRLKTQFDPHGIFNPGRLYPEL